jgi:hypothetical protein
MSTTAKRALANIPMISEHASPLAAAGGVDSGGQNIYVAHTAPHLANPGYAVDVFSRRDRGDLPDVVEWYPNVRVVHVRAGPARFVRKESLLPLMPNSRGTSSPPRAAVGPSPLCALPRVLHTTRASGDCSGSPMRCTPSSARIGFASPPSLLAVRFAPTQPRESVVAEITVLPVQETSWP